MSARAVVDSTAAPPFSANSPTSANKCPAVKIASLPKSSSDKSQAASKRSSEGERLQPQVQPGKARASSSRSKQPLHPASPGVPTPAHVRSLAQAAARLAKEAASRNSQGDRDCADYTRMNHHPMAFGAGCLFDGFTVNNGGYQNTGSVLTKPFPSVKNTMGEINEEA